MHSSLSAVLTCTQVLIVVLVVLGAVMGRAFPRQRQFPGQRLHGATNYGTHSFGGHGYNSKPVSSKYSAASRQPHHNMM